MTLELIKLMNSECDIKFLNELTNADLRKHCINAMLMSYYKYGHISQCVGEKALIYLENALNGFEKSGNHEHLIDVINYCMIRQMFYKDDYSKMLKIALKYDKIFDETKYFATDSNTSTKPISVREFLYSRLSYDGKAPRNMKY